MEVLDTSKHGFWDKISFRKTKESMVQPDMLPFQSASPNDNV
jgi:hypothetical protein